MLERDDITDSEFAFLVAHKISLSHVYDARGQSATAWHSSAKAKGMIFGLSEPCHAGHRLKERNGHCIECNTSQISYIRRHSNSGYVYIASSRKGRIHKVGSTIDLKTRRDNLQREVYAGCDDWTIIARCAVKEMGKVEFNIHKSLKKHAVERTYAKGDRIVNAREVFGPDLVPVWQAYKSEVKWITAEEKTKKKVPNFDSYDFKIRRNQSSR
jgi:hypothetical protein